MSFFILRAGGRGLGVGGAHHGRVLVIAKKYLAMGEKKKRHKKTFALQASAKGVEKQNLFPTKEGGVCHVRKKKKTQS